LDQRHEPTSSFINRRVRTKHLRDIRQKGEATDIAGVAIMLVSKAGAFITGQIIAVDGGTSVIN
jgi:enoyl-[acyl-carrier-protein] reductase (NADH)